MPSPFRISTKILSKQQQRGPKKRKWWQCQWCLRRLSASLSYLARLSLALTVHRNHPVYAVNCCLYNSTWWRHFLTNGAHWIPHLRTSHFSQSRRDWRWPKMQRMANVDTDAKPLQALSPCLLVKRHWTNNLRTAVQSTHLTCPRSTVVDSRTAMWQQKIVREWFQ